jgi:hydrogenase expression/formation protein HypC
VCLAVPGRLIRTAGDTPLTRTGRVDFGGVSREVNLALVPEAVPGDHLLVHAGVAITVLSADESDRTLDELERLDEMA